MKLFKKRNTKEIEARLKKLRKERLALERKRKLIELEKAEKRRIRELKYGKIKEVGKTISKVGHTIGQSDFLANWGTGAIAFVSEEATRKHHKKGGDKI